MTVMTALISDSSQSDQHVHLLLYIGKGTSLSSSSLIHLKTALVSAAALRNETGIEYHVWVMDHLPSNLLSAGYAAIVIPGGSGK